MMLDPVWFLIGVGVGVPIGAIAFYAFSAWFGDRRERARDRRERREEIIR